MLVTGHTGFKGSWLCRVLSSLGAEVTGIALDPPEGPSAFAAMQVATVLAADHRCDVRDAGKLAVLVRDARPEVVLHLAAQPLVALGLRDPAGTFAINAGGTVNLLQALRGLPGVASAVVVTSDKVYRNDGAGRPFTEEDALGAHEPYGASKAAAEIAVASWRAAFASEMPPIGTARAGNVIGGGDFAQMRIVPDLVRAILAGRPLEVRLPDATRPFQHVLDVLRGYLLLAEALAVSPATAPQAVNLGPRDGEIRVRDLLALWGGVDWRQVPANGLEEVARLALDSTLATRRLGWEPLMGTAHAVQAAAAWYRAWADGADMVEATQAEVAFALAGVALAA